jgi:hypothetical protein
LANPQSFDSVQAYIEDHLAPVSAELHRLANELFVPGSTAEEHAMDMVPDPAAKQYFSRLDRRLDPSPKHVIFDGSEYFSLPKDLLRNKQAKVQLTAVLYVKGQGEADFRLVRDDGEVIDDSLIRVISERAVIRSAILPFGDLPRCVSPDSRVYYIEAGSLERSCIPVCRRFSMSFVYI